jgi:ribosome-binding factor A
MREFGREERVGAEMQRELASLLRNEARDPRLRQVTVQEVRVARDLSHARVFFSLLEHQQPAEIEAVLRKAAGFLRRRLAETLMLRTVPVLHFEYDHSFETGMRLSGLIDQAIAQESSHSTAEQDV